MIIYYNWRDNVDYEYEPQEDVLEQVKIDILENLDKEDLIETIIAEDDIEECYYDKIKDLLEDDAREQYEQEIANSEDPYKQSDFI